MNVVISFAKRCEPINTVVSFIWWIIGFYWVVEEGGDKLLGEAPNLYWSSVIFLAIDVFFAVFCVVLACLVGIALCYCLPCIIALLYAVAGTISFTASSATIGRSRNHFTSSVAIESLKFDCCICLSSYEDGVELHTLPCNHHFHSNCIVKWFKMRATCLKEPLIKLEDKI
ncbi:unnamed protein product [Arabis nemorensis]|uniref:RING-type E3 ubiquitin transferase n=1 Tax=Arabis nemorensis TaxID=586526 RepID=A0A565BR15_9BRAS|nr:unnamed protein product [Arabis nemorensis]